jgi:hypothetical protein
MAHKYDNSIRDWIILRIKDSSSKKIRNTLAGVRKGRSLKNGGFLFPARHTSFLVRRHIANKRYVVWRRKSLCI